ncbi:hypothetical protein HYH03_012631 [Edaphochlamys debaryana]|uniref:Protein kinase domain-containing protein n=1 Tax=Edaphochlamys debaryana TaxID=47281 RepID=A0A836BU82_9CHLO|nr:hypothetical protein HYH03_012631 [Edaphochlamys debaryana]|eukprot:KAG2488832.1 hypothetical protein HYH03_012631 [Edaphochlamys debaryana]
MHEDLDKTLCRSRGRPLPPDLVRCVAWQLLGALEHCHAHGVIHRDVKPANVLLDRRHSNGSGGDTLPVVVKLCDFGLARWLPEAEPGCRRRATMGGAGEAVEHSCPAHASPPSQHQQLSSYVVTRWYRAPEVLAGGPYGSGVDIWALGCTLAQLATGRTLFPGTSEADQLWLIARTLGPLPCGAASRRGSDSRSCAGSGAVGGAGGIADAGVAGSRPGSTSGERVRAASAGGGAGELGAGWAEPCAALAAKLGPADPGLASLIAQCLVMDPAARPSAAQLRRLPYFECLRRDSCSSAVGKPQTQTQSRGERLPASAPAVAKHAGTGADDGGGGGGGASLEGAAAVAGARVIRVPRVMAEASALLGITGEQAAVEAEAEADGPSPTAAAAAVSSAGAEAARLSWECPGASATAAGPAGLASARSAAAAALDAVAAGSANFGGAASSVVTGASADGGGLRDAPADAAVAAGAAVLHTAAAAPGRAGRSLTPPHQSRPPPAQLPTLGLDSMPDAAASAASGTASAMCTAASCNNLLYNTTYAVPVYGIYDALLNTGLLSSAPKFDGSALLASIVADSPQAWPRHAASSALVTADPPPPPGPKLGTSRTHVRQPSVGGVRLPGCGEAGWGAGTSPVRDLAPSVRPKSKSVTLVRGPCVQLRPPPWRSLTRGSNMGSQAQAQAQAQAHAQAQAQTQAQPGFWRRSSWASSTCAGSSHAVPAAGVSLSLTRSGALGDGSSSAGGPFVWAVDLFRRMSATFSATTAADGGGAKPSSHGGFLHSRSEVPPTAASPEAMPEVSSPPQVSGWLWRLQRHRHAAEAAAPPALPVAAAGGGGGCRTPLASGVRDAIAAFFDEESLPAVRTPFGDVPAAAALGMPAFIPIPTADAATVLQPRCRTSVTRYHPYVMVAGDQNTAVRPSAVGPAETASPPAWRFDVRASAVPCTSYGGAHPRPRTSIASLQHATYSAAAAAAAAAVSGERPLSQSSAGDLGLTPTGQDATAARSSSMVLGLHRPDSERPLRPASLASWTPPSAAAAPAVTRRPTSTAAAADAAAVVVGAVAVAGFGSAVAASGAGAPRKWYPVPGGSGSAASGGAVGGAERGGGSEGGGGSGVGPGAPVEKGSRRAGVRSLVRRIGRALKGGR